jgi:hypothetical protein
MTGDINLLLTRRASLLKFTKSIRGSFIRNQKETGVVSSSSENFLEQQKTFAEISTKILFFKHALTLAYFLREEHL